MEDKQQSEPVCANANNTKDKEGEEERTEGKTEGVSRKRLRYSALNSLAGCTGDAMKRPLQEKLDDLWNGFAEREDVSPGSAGAARAIQVMTGALRRGKYAPIKTRVPLSTTRRIMKSDDEVRQMVSKDAVAIMGKIVELFVMDLTVRALHVASGEERRVIKVSDIVTGACSNIMFDFLCDIFPVKEFREAREAYCSGAQQPQSLQLLQKQRQYDSQFPHSGLAPLPPSLLPRPLGNARLMKKQQMIQRQQQTEAEKIEAINYLQHQQLSSLYNVPGLYSVSSIASNIIDQLSEGAQGLSSQLDFNGPSQPASLQNSSLPPISSSSLLLSQIQQQHQPQQLPAQQQMNEFPALWSQSRQIDYPYKFGLSSNFTAVPTDADIEEEENDLYDEDEVEEDDDYSSEDEDK